MGELKWKSVGLNQPARKFSIYQFNSRNISRKVALSDSESGHRKSYFYRDICDKGPRNEVEREPRDGAARGAPYEECN